MKIPLIAENVGVSVATLYRKLAENGLELKQFRDNDGNISAEKMSELKAIFSADNNKLSEKTREIALLSQKLLETENSLAEAEKRASDAEAKASAAEAECVRLSEQLDDMRRQLDDLRSDRDDWKRAAAESRALQMQQLQRLLPERVPFTQRVRGWFTRTKNKGEE